MNLRRFFAELISRTSATRFSSQLLCLHLSGAIQTLGSGTMLSMVAVMS